MKLHGYTKELDQLRWMDLNMEMTADREVWRMMFHRLQVIRYKGGNKCIFLYKEGLFNKTSVSTTHDPKNDRENNVKRSNTLMSELIERSQIRIHYKYVFFLNRHAYCFLKPFLLDSQWMLRKQSIRTLSIAILRFEVVHRRPIEIKLRF